MKKNLFMVAAVVLMALVSCNKEEFQNNTNGVVFVAELEQESTKTALGDKGVEGRKALWVEGDKISINGTEFSAVSGGEVAEFTTTDTKFTEADVYRAVYPASSYYSDTHVSIPETQDGTFANASIAVAESNTNTLVFNNFSSILKFQVPTACEIVTFESNVSVNGRVKVEYTEGNFTADYGGITSGANRQKITVKAEGGFVPGKDYYVAVRPYTHKFTVKIDGNLSKASEKSVTVERTKIYNLGVLPEPKNYKLYVENDSDYSKLYLYLFDSAGNNSWPGAELTEKETINGVEYFVYTPTTDQIEKEYTYIFNNNKGSQVEENKKIKFDKDNYLRLTKKYSEVVDASNKGKDDPLTLYIRNDKNWSKLNYYMWIPNGATNAGWPGKSVDMTKKTQIDNSTYYYVEINAHSYTRVIINNGSSQTNDLTIKSTTEDVYVANKDTGYCWKGSEQAL